MKLPAGIVILVTASVLLAACETTTPPPDLNSVQPTQQQMHQEKLQKALQS